MCRASCGAQPEIGAEHLNTQIAEGNLDGCLSKQGKNAEAVHLQREVLAAQELPRGRALQHADDRQQSLWIMGRRTRRRKRYPARVLRCRSRNSGQSIRSMRSSGPFAAEGPRGNSGQTIRS